jgi:hypothetical protein
MNRWKMGFLVLVSSLGATSVAMAAQPTVTYGVNGTSDCFDNGRGSTSGGHTTCCPMGDLIVDSDEAGNWIGASCQIHAGNPLPGNGGSGTGGTGQGGGVSGGGSGSTCNAACQQLRKDAKKKQCLTEAGTKYQACRTNANSFLDFCLNNWAYNEAVDQCTGGGGRIGLGIDHVARPPIVPLQDCDYIVTDGQDGTRHPPIIVCRPRIDSLGRLDWWDPQTQSSAWAPGSCLEDWTDGTQGGDVSSGSGTQGGNHSYSIQTPWVPFLTAGGTTASHSSSSGNTVTVREGTGMYEVCSAAKQQEGNACLKNQNEDVQKCGN